MSCFQGAEAAAVGNSKLHEVTMNSRGQTRMGRTRVFSLSLFYSRPPGIIFFPHPHSEPFAMRFVVNWPRQAIIL